MTAQLSNETANETAWLCLRFEHMALNAHNVRYQQGDSVAITNEHQIIQLTHRAQEQGVARGYSIGHALMLNPELVLLERDEPREALLLAQLKDWAYRYTSHISVYDEHTLLLEVGRSASLFRGFTHLQHLLNQDLEQQGLDVDCGFAKTPKAAHILSFCGQTQWTLAQSETLLPNASLGDLQISTKTLSQLHSCGLFTLSDILAIPYHELGQRFGLEFLSYWERLLGLVADPQVLIRPVEVFNRRIEFAEPISNWLWIEQQIKRLLQDFLNFIKQHNLHCRGFEWHFYESGADVLNTIPIGINTATPDLSILWELTDLTLTRQPLEGAFTCVELSSDQLVARTIHANDLFDPEPDYADFDCLIDRLSNRLGHNAVTQLSAAPEQLPELAQSTQTLNADGQGLAHKAQAQVTVSVERSETLLDKDLPLWLLDSPKRLKQTHNEPQLQGQPLTLIHGPDRICSHWWAQIQSRDYYIARQLGGRLLWVYFERSQRQWFLQGAYG